MNEVRELLWNWLAVVIRFGGKNPSVLKIILALTDGSAGISVFDKNAIYAIVQGF